ncbi:hypothetical protein V0288_08350 [Pannus brasiliensis CCIBt3594]|uniref:Uncharacterized protein n=1 Tax=Pannus brasiliensis CCIBt3594 TaxID=1427578 RepID=A0AAW9QQT9_9CHRO
MNENLQALYSEKSFFPRVYGSLPNNTDVELAISRDRTPKTDIIDPEARKEVLSTLLKRMRRNKTN